MKIARKASELLERNPKLRLQGYFMNYLDIESSLNILQRFASLPILQKEITGNDSDLYFAALDALNQDNDEWLKNSELVKEIIPRLWSIKPKNSETLLKTIFIFKKIKLNNYRLPFLKQKKIFREFLEEARNNSISICSTGIINVNFKKDFQEQHWDFLNKLPVTQIKFEGVVDIESLLNFLKFHPDIITLSLNTDSNISDEDLEKLSENLPNIKKFSITSKFITTIPALICNQLTTLECSECLALTTINIPNATTLYCEECPVLASINAPKAITFSSRSCPILSKIEAPNAITLDCSNCWTLLMINAPHVTTLDCSNCRALTTIFVPNVTMLHCKNCQLLTKIEVDNVKKIDCSECTSLTTIDATSATTLYCWSCPLLTTVNAPKATKLICSDSKALTTINALSAIHLNCSNCTALTSINAPNANTIDCSDCPALVTINAPNATTLACNYCTALTTINSPNISTLNCNYSTALSLIVAIKTTELILNCLHCQALDIIAPNMIALTCNDYSAFKNEVKFDLFRDIYRNIITNFAQTPNDLIVFLSKHIQNTRSELKNINLGDYYFLNQWFIDVYKFIESSELNSINDRERVDNFLTVLLNLVNKENNFKDIDLEWFQELKKLDSLRQKVRRVLWLGTIFASNNKEVNLLFDKKAVPILKVIGELTNPFLLQEASRSLFSIYSTKDVETKKRKTIVLNNKKPYLILLALFFSTSEIDVETIKKLLTCLEPTYYKDFKILNPILEMTCLLFKNPFFKKEDQEKILKLVLKLEVPKMSRIIFSKKTNEKKTIESEPKIDVKEEFKIARTKLKQDFNAQIAQITQNRKDQRRWVNVCRDLLLFQQHEALRSVETIKELLEIHQNFCREFFGVEKELAEDFSNFFKSDRYPNALFTYISRLQTLREDQKAIITPLLGKFINSCLTGEFLNNRYDFSDNPHLKIIFKNNPTLLEKWKEPLEISILQIKQTTSIIILQPNLKSIVSAESWEDFLLMGTEVHNSCQRIDGDPKLIKCLLAYILDGKNKVILVKDTLGKIVARTVLRIMWDKAQKCPVLFMERLYTKGINKEFSILIRKGCETLAKKMKLTLVANKNDFPSGLPYNGELFALGGPCPFEYVDDLQEILSEGKFTIQNCNIICDFKAL